MPDDYFSFQNEALDTKEYFGLHPDVIKAGVEPFVQLVNHLAEAGYIDASAATKQLFAYRFSGRMRPEKVEPIEWHGKNGNSYELIYLVRNLTERANYRKMRNFFTGPKWVKDRVDEDILLVRIDVTLLGDTNDVGKGDDVGHQGQCTDNSHHRGIGSH